MKPEQLTFEPRLPSRYDDAPRPDTRPIEERFREFHEAHPDVYEALAGLARRAVADGRKRIGIKMLWEVVRWQHMCMTDSDGEFKLNNIFHAHYARLLMKQEPDLAGLFELRHASGDDEDAA